jgi:hypothetical protein
MIEKFRDLDKLG